MSFGVFVLGLLVMVSSLLVPNSTCSCHDWMLSNEECEFKSRNWWIAYLMMFLGAAIAVYGGSS